MRHGIYIVLDSIPFLFFKNRVFGWLISGLPSPTFLHAPHMKFAYKQVASKQVLFSKTFSTQLEIPCALHTQSHIYSPGSWLRISEPSDNTSSRARWGSYSSHEKKSISLENELELLMIVLRTLLQPRPNPSTLPKLSLPPHLL